MRLKYNLNHIFIYKSFVSIKNRCKRFFIFRYLINNFLRTMQDNFYNSFEVNKKISQKLKRDGENLCLKNGLMNY